MVAGQGLSVILHDDCELTDNILQQASFDKIRTNDFWIIEWIWVAGDKVRNPLNPVSTMASMRRS